MTVILIGMHKLSQNILLLLIVLFWRQLRLRLNVWVFGYVGFVSRHVLFVISVGMARVVILCHTLDCGDGVVRFVLYDLNRPQVPSSIQLDHVEVKPGRGIRPIAMRLFEGIWFPRLDSFSLSLADDGTIIGYILVVGKTQRLAVPPHIARPLHGVKLREGLPDCDFSSELVMKRVAKTIELKDAIAKINDPWCVLLLLVGISKLYFVMRTCSPRAFERAQYSFDAALRSALIEALTLTHILYVILVAP
ncbi:hypothetical protein Tco_1343349 [Tanacetum coccineum]